MQLRFADINGTGSPPLPPTKRDQLADPKLQHRRGAWLRGPDPLRDGHRAADPSPEGFAKSQLWCEIVALACELVAWTQMLALTGTARRWEPKRLGLRLFGVAGGLAQGGGRLRLRLAAMALCREITAGVPICRPLPGG